MSKKLAEGSNALVLDVKCGRGAFMQRTSDARALARVLVEIGTAAGVRTEAFITRMDAPLGRGVGNAIEIAECISVLKGQGPADLTDLVVQLAARMVRLADKASSDEAAAAVVRSALDSGAALEKLRALIAWQGGDAAVVDEPGRLPKARAVHPLKAERAGFVTALDALLIGRAAVALGAGRDKKGDEVDLAAGIWLRKKPGEAVSVGDTLMDLHYNDDVRLKAAVALAKRAAVIEDQAPPEQPLVLGWVRDSGETMFVAGA